MFNYRDLAGVTKTFRIELGPLRARGVPAVLLGVGGVVLAAGFARLVAENPSAMIETIREASRFLETARGDKAMRLKSGDDR
ncbi:MAG: hypothetical protein JO101_07015 [Candidatus Eremiobacteraeota bacterium]|nr:hypothetical protein [Candidatus Eremiobacteraeota bacterium]MBV8355054.1 hypothetical protein [Candidatus Eremiobacteraeota bacterium]